MEYLYNSAYFLGIYPLKQLYFHGPRLWGWGGWEGFAPEDICSHITQVTSSVWKIQKDNCTDLIERKFHSFLVTVFGVSYIFVLYKILSYCWLRYFILAPILREFKETFQKEKIND